MSSAGNFVKQASIMSQMPPTEVVVAFLVAAGAMAEVVAGMILAVGVAVKRISLA
jgi:hypothetical protein